MSVLHHRFDFLFDDGKAARIIAGAPATAAGEVTSTLR